MAEDDEKAGESGKAKGGHARAEALPPERKSEIAKLAAEARWSSHPLRVLEDADTGHRFVVYTTKDGLRAEARFDGEDPWFTQLQLAEIFGVDVRTVNEHIQRFTDDGELDEATIRDFRIVRQEGARQVERSIIHYGLDVAFYVGYRVNSAEGRLFRRWATNMLVQLATKGFVVDVRRLKEPEVQDRVSELREILQDIRSDEANLYREVRAICATCADYDPKSKASEQFYQRAQAKIVYAVTSRTPAMLLMGRANADAPDMGLRTWPGENIRQADVTVSKNYLDPGEAEELNRVTSLLLDYLLDQLKIGRIATMPDAERAFDTLIKTSGRTVLSHGGGVKAATAKEHAIEQYKLFAARQKALRHAEADRAVGELIEKVKKLPKPKRPEKKT